MILKPTGSALGMEIQGVDLSKPLTDAELAQIKDAVVRNGVVCFRDQNVGAQSFVDFAKAFGPIEPYGSTLAEYLLPEQQDIIVLSNIVENGKSIGVTDAGSFWHVDRSYVAKPAWLSFLFALEVPFNDDGTPTGDTEFSSMTAAFKALPQAMREKLEKLNATHQYVFRWSEDNGSMPPVLHPISLKHPVSKEPCLFVNKGFTNRIPDLSEDESKVLLEELFEHAAKPEFLYRHKWQKGDVVIWDNYATQHRATGGYSLPKRRHLWRTTVQGFDLQ
ncbi:MAG: TauD/TfdA family dioxygenase [Burkholderiaceae bacterium]|nr:TauD/TfdA family dioxygenase [Burkholderiaceae bacterium]